MINSPVEHYPAAVEVVAVTAICVAFALLVTSFACHSSATFDETVRLPAGITYLRWHDYRLNPDHPPFLKKLIALPLLSEKIWLPDLGTSDHSSIAAADWRELPDSHSVLESAWLTSKVEYFKQWIFGHSLLYGLRDETIERFRQRDPTIRGPYTVPATEQLTRADFYNDSDALLFRARMVVMVLGVLLILCLYAWSRVLFGIAGGVLSILLFCFDPSVIAHSGLVTIDIAMTLFLLATLYFLWRICRRVEVASIVFFLIFFACSVITKFSATTLIPIFWLAVGGRVFSREVWPVTPRLKFSLETLFRRLVFVAGLFLLALLVSFVAIWWSYDFRYPAAKGASSVASFPIEQALYRNAAIQRELKRWPNGLPEQERGELEARIAEDAQSRPLTPAGNIILFATQHRLLPEAYLYGLVHANMDPLMRTSFLRGQYSSSGFRASYLWAFLLKTPLPVLLAMVAAIITAVARGFVRTWNFVFIASAIAICSLSVSMFAPVNIAHRYLLPIYPFLCLLCGALGPEWAHLPGFSRRLLGMVAVLVIVVSSQWVFYPPWRPQQIHPHYLAYFNEIAGGPRNGYKSLVDSNLDWGQELKHLKTWLDDRNITEPVWLSYFGMADPRWFQIRHISVPKALGGYRMEASPYSTFEDSGAADKAVRAFLDDLKPGQYLAVSATNAAAVYLGAQARDVWEHVLASSTYVDQVGYSIFIYRIGTNDDAALNDATPPH